MLNNAPNKVLGCEPSLRIPIVKLADYRKQIDELLTSDSPFATTTAAHLLAQGTRRDPKARYRRRP